MVTDPDMREEFKQEATGSMAYPKKGTLNRFAFKAPLILWRLGLGPLLSHPSLGGSRMLLLTTWGRKSKLPRHTMLSCVQLGDRVYVCSGWGPKTDWYRNIAANPSVTVQQGAQHFFANARRVQELSEFSEIAENIFRTGGDSHFEDWLVSLDIKYDPADMMEKRERVYYVAFDASEKTGPPPMPANLRWVWAAIAVAILGVWFTLIIR